MLFIPLISILQWRQHDYTRVKLLRHRSTRSTLDVQTTPVSPSLSSPSPTNTPHRLGIPYDARGPKNLPPGARAAAEHALVTKLEVSHAATHAACQSHGNKPMLEAVSTALVVQDMERIVEALGEDGLNFWGYVLFRGWVNAGLMVGQVFVWHDTRIDVRSHAAPSSKAYGPRRRIRRRILPQRYISMGARRAHRYAQGTLP
jgi:hypothetical protein